MGSSGSTMNEYRILLNTILTSAYINVRKTVPQYKSVG